VSRNSISEALPAPFYVPLDLFEGFVGEVALLDRFVPASDPRNSSHVSFSCFRLSSRSFVDSSTGIEVRLILIYPKFMMLCLSPLTSSSTV
jgi:hypothetical protein